MLPDLYDELTELCKTNNKWYENPTKSLSNEQQYQKTNIRVFSNHSMD